jgi:hypothetical protein
LSISGRLVAPDGSTPLSGSITARRSGSDTELIRPADSDGRFVVGGLSPGVYEITGETTEGRTEIKTIPLAQGASANDVTLIVPSSGTISGQVLGLLPGEIGRASVSARTSGFHTETAIAESGMYLLRGIPHGPVTVTVLTALDRRIEKAVQVSGQGITTADFHFAPGYRVSGRIMRGGLPARFITLAATPLDGQQVAAEGESSQSGQYSIEGLPVGAYSLRPEGEPPIRVYVSGNLNVDIELPANEMRGVISDAETKLPIREAYVEFRSAEARRGASTNHEGRFLVDGLTAGQYVMSVYKSGYDIHEETVEVTANATDVAVEILANKGVPLRVLSATTNAPLDSVWVIESIGDRNGVRLEISLDETGVGYIPASLRGKNLLISRVGYSLGAVRAWDGRALSLRLSPGT